MYICKDPVYDPIFDFCWYCFHDEYRAPEYCRRDDTNKFMNGNEYCDNFRCRLREKEPQDLSDIK